MALSKEQEELYRKTMEEAKAQLETIDDEMEKEIQRAREKLAQLQDSKRSFRQLYEGAARLLGMKVESEDDDKGAPKVEPAKDIKPDIAPPEPAKAPESEELVKPQAEKVANQG